MGRVGLNPTRIPNLSSHERSTAETGSAEGLCLRGQRAAPGHICNFYDVNTVTPTGQNRTSTTKTGIGFRMIGEGSGSGEYPVGHNPPEIPLSPDPPRKFGLTFD